VSAAAPIERQSTGTGTPVTVFAHGLAGGIPDTRPLGSTVAGTRVFFQFRGHGRSARPSGPWSFADLADDLAAVADATGATRAVGVSLGAAALCRLLAGDPGRFERLVFFLPAALSSAPLAVSRERLAALSQALESRAEQRVVEILADDVPAGLTGTTPGATVYLHQRALALLAHPLAPELAGVLEGVPCPDPTVLGAVTAPALVIAARGEARHPVPVAEQLAQALGKATLQVYEQPGPLWTARADLRARISGFLNEAG
jgi:pimeloyl-ACP methyl ester carboxylesterase